MPVAKALNSGGTTGSGFAAVAGAVVAAGSGFANSGVDRTSARHRFIHLTEHIGYRFADIPPLAAAPARPAGAKLDNCLSVKQRSPSA
jgi:hypothetical protein